MAASRRREGGHGRTFSDRADLLVNCGFLRAPERLDLDLGAARRALSRTGMYDMVSGMPLTLKAVNDELAGLSVETELAQGPDYFFFRVRRSALNRYLHLVMLSDIRERE